MKDLPELGEQDQGSVREVLGVSPEWQWDKGIVYDPGYAKFKLNHKGLRATGNVEPLNLQYDAFLAPENSKIKVNGRIDPMNMGYEASVKQNGEKELIANMILLRGLLSLKANMKEGDNRYQLQYQKDF